MPTKPTNAVERAFDGYLNLTTAEKREFNLMMRGHEWDGPPAQATIPIPTDKRSHKKTKPAPAAPQPAEQAEAKTA